VYITQDDEDLDVEFILEMSPHMWEELMTAKPSLLCIAVICGKNL